MRTPIWGDQSRDNGAPKGFSEPTFTFLNRIAGTYWEHQRQLIQRWADRIPDIRTYAELVARLQDGDDDQFRSAYLELYVHQSLLLASFLVTSHPELTNGCSKRPDFLAERAGQAFYVEVIHPGTPGDVKGSSRRRFTFFDTINSLANANFWLHVQELEVGPEPARGARLRRTLANWLDGLSSQTAQASVEPEPLMWDDNGWRAEIVAIPASSTANRKAAIGVYPAMSSSDHVTPIRKALIEKGDKYGALDKPLVVVVGSNVWSADREPLARALYGSDVFLKDANDSFQAEVNFRIPDGYFGRPARWRNRQVSAVLNVNQLQPHRPHHAEVSLWHHPNPKHLLPDLLGLPASSVHFGNDLLVETVPPVVGTDFFKLPQHWPPGQRWQTGG